MRVKLSVWKAKKPKTNFFLFQLGIANIIDMLHFTNNLRILRKGDVDNLEIIITGDFNRNLLKTEDDSHTIKLKDLFDIYQLEQHILKLTRITTTTESLTDLILTNLDESKTIDSGVMHVGISDHILVYVRRKASIPKETSKLVKTRRFKNFDAIHFQNDLKHSFNDLFITLILTQLGSIGKRLS